MEVRIGPAAPEHYDALGELTVEAYVSACPDDLVRYDIRVDELRDVAGRAAQVLVATDPGGTLLGGVTYVPGPESALAEFADPDAAGVRQLAVARRAQGRGVGAALLDGCIAKAVGAARTQLVLHSVDWMTSAHRLYERRGFRRDPGLDFESEPGVWVRGYRLRLQAVLM